MQTTNRLSVFLVSTLMLLAAFTPALTISTMSMAPRMLVGGANDSSWTSTNWSGYAVTAAKGAVTQVKGSWVVPAVTGKTTAYSSFWVGIDGFSSNTVEQIGTDSDISSGRPVYYAWFEFYPSPMYQITSLTVLPGDVMTATVTYSGTSRGGFGRTNNLFTVSITDARTSRTYTTTGTVSNAAQSSAEWIAEAPSSSRGVLPLANFGKVNFGYDRTSVVGTCYAIIGGTSGQIGSFGANVQQITMVTSRGSITKAAPTALSTDGTSFNVTWASAGP